MTDRRFSISFVARRFGMRVSALRYYDRIGLLKPAERRGNVRYYDRVELRRLALIHRLHRQGMVSLADTAALLSRGPAWHDVLRSSAGELRRRIEEMQAAHRTLEHLLQCPGRDPIRDCPYLHEEFETEVDAALAAQRG
nr:MerR family transcriptional regulator [Pseudonocardia acaciae]